MNKEALIRAVREAGILLEIADASREGELAYLAVTGGAARRLVCDFGSQSMQLAWKTVGRIDAQSWDFGYERAYATFFRGALSAQSYHTLCAVITPNRNYRAIIIEKNIQRYISAFSSDR